MAHHARAGVVPEHALDAPGGGVRPVADDDHTRMLRVAHAHAAAVVQAHPGGAARGVEQGVQQRPVGHRVRTVTHGLGLAVRAGHRATVQVVAADDDGRLQLARAHHLVEGQAGAVALAQADPADACGQALEGDALTRHVQPAVQVGVLREQLLHLGVGLADVFGVTRQRHPAERPLAAAEQRPHVGGHEAGEVEGVLHAGIQRHLADVVAVIHRGNAQGLKVEHGLHMHRTTAARGLAQLGVARVVSTGGLPLRQAPARGQIAIDQIVRRGLVGHDVGPQAASADAPHQFGQQLGRVAQQRHRARLLGRRVACDARQGVVQISGLLVHVTGLQPHVDAALLALDVQRTSPGEGGGQRLRATHAAETRGQDPLAREVTAEVLLARLDKGLVSALNDALAADVDPGAGRHLAVHHQALAVQLVEVLPGGPLGHEVGVGDQHTRRVFVRAEHAHGLAGLDKQRLVRFQAPQRGQDGLEAVPVARRLANAAVDHQGVGVFGHLRVQVVLEHAVGGLDKPVGAAEGRAARRTHGPRLGHLMQGGEIGHGRLGSV